MKEDKNQSFQDDIIHACIKFMEEGSIPDVDVSLIYSCCNLIPIHNSQYPIDDQLLKKLDEDRKARFSKVDIHIIIIIL